MKRARKKQQVGRSLIVDRRIRNVGRIRHAERVKAWIAASIENANARQVATETN